MRSKASWLLAGATLVAFAGCTPVDPGFGEAVRYDMAAQTIEPDPVYPEDGAKPGDSGEHAQKATERYRKGATKPVREMRTGGGSGGGSGGGGGGSTPGS